MPLDSNLFSDLGYGVMQHRATTWWLLPGDLHKFSMGTPAEVSNSLRRTWEVCLTSERIVEDISRFPAALKKIIAAKGAYVPELDKRTGRRKRKPTRRFDYHPDCAAVKASNDATYASWLSSALPEAEGDASESEAASEESEPDPSDSDDE
jgi:hypothetical protein